MTRVVEPYRARTRRKVSGGATTLLLLVPVAVALAVWFATGEEQAGSAQRPRAPAAATAAQRTPPPAAAQDAPQQGAPAKPADQRANTAPVGGGAESRAADTAAGAPPQQPVATPQSQAAAERGDRPPPAATSKEKPAPPVAPKGKASSPPERGGILRPLPFVARAVEAAVAMVILAGVGFGLFLLLRPPVSAPPPHPQPPPRPGLTKSQTAPPSPPILQPPPERIEPRSVEAKTAPVPIPVAPPGLPPSLFLEEGSWKVVATSVAGTSHARTSMPCQDAAYCRVLNGDLLVAAVADGAGSARYGDLGAQIAVKKAVDTVASAIDRNRGLATAQWREVLQAAMRVALAHIEVTAALRAVDKRDLATTLLLFAATPRSLVAAQIGDGAIVVKDGNGGLHALTTPQSGEYANTTTFLISPDALEKVQHQKWPGSFTAIAAFTDGLQRLALAMPKGEPHAPFFTPLFDFAERARDGRDAVGELDQFLRSGKVTQRADDDLTLMLARVTR